MDNPRGARGPAEPVPRLARCAGLAVALALLAVSPMAAARAPSGAFTGVVVRDGNQLRLQTDSGSPVLVANWANQMRALPRDMLYYATLKQTPIPQHDIEWAAETAAFEGQTITIKGVLDDSGQTLRVDEFAPGDSPDFLAGRIEIVDGRVGVRSATGDFVPFSDRAFAEQMSHWERTGVILPGAPDATRGYAGNPSELWILTLFRPETRVVPEGRVRIGMTPYEEVSMVGPPVDEAALGQRIFARGRPLPPGTPLYDGDPSTQRRRFRFTEISRPVPGDLRTPARYGSRGRAYSGTRSVIDTPEPGEVIADNVAIAMDCDFANYPAAGWFRSLELITGWSQRGDTAGAFVGLHGPLRARYDDSGMPWIYGNLDATVDLQGEPRLRELRLTGLTLGGTAGHTAVWLSGLSFDHYDDGVLSQQSLSLFHLNAAVTTASMESLRTGTAGLAAFLRFDGQLGVIAQRERVHAPDHRLALSCGRCDGGFGLLGPAEIAAGVTLDRFTAEGIAGIGSRRYAGFDLAVDPTGWFGLKTDRLSLHAGYTRRWTDLGLGPRFAQNQWEASIRFRP